MVAISPIIRLDTQESFTVIGAVPIDLIVVRLQDLVSKCNFKFNETYYQIISCGGLHEFTKFNGNILLSLIMKDQIIANFGPKLYAEAINCLKPDTFTTIDGETYEGEVWLSSKELERITLENKELIQCTPNFKPIGLVKGCTPRQIENHAKLFNSMGIDDLIFHVGDFFRLNNPDMIKRARMYGLIIRKHAKTLILYGLGSPKRFLEFSFADRYVTFRHFITATKRVKCIGSKKIKQRGTFDSQLVVHNFLQLQKSAKSLKTQSKLYDGELNGRWV